MGKGLLIQESFYEAMKYLPDADRLQLFDGLCMYGLDGILPDNLSPAAKSMFILMKPNIDASAKKYASAVSAGKKGGRPSKKQTVTEESQLKKANENQSVNQNKNQNQNQSDNQRENHDYDYDLDYDYNSDLELDSDYDSDKDSMMTADEPPHSPKEKVTKHKYGEYKNVLLSDDGLARLRTELPNWQELVERLSEYIASSGKKYKSHYATLRSWARREPKVSKPPQVFPEDDLSGIL